MKSLDIKIISMLIVPALFAAGCATARPRKAPEQDLNAQVSELQGQLQQKDQQIQELEAQLASQERSLTDSQDFSSGSKKSAIIRVSGVSAADVQRALVRAGFNPGPVDGRIGSQTKKAIKAFQRRNNLHADGIVGEKTWALLR